MSDTNEHIADPNLSSSAYENENYDPQTQHSGHRHKKHKDKEEENFTSIPMKTIPAAATLPNAPPTFVTPSDPPPSYPTYAYPPPTAGGVIPNTGQPVYVQQGQPGQPVYAQQGQPGQPTVVWVQQQQPQAKTMDLMFIFNSFFL